jgi:hypothetical protein
MKPGFNWDEKGRQSFPKGIHVKTNIFGEVPASIKGVITPTQWKEIDAVEIASGVTFSGDSYDEAWRFIELYKIGKIHEWSKIVQFIADSKSSRSKSGYKNVYPNGDGRWKAVVVENGKVKHLGIRTTAYQAHCEVVKWKIEGLL